MKKFLSAFLAWVLILGSIPLSVFAAESEQKTNRVETVGQVSSGDLVGTEQGEGLYLEETYELYNQADGNKSGVPEVTRLEWLKALTTTFEMTVEESNYPDNYFTDIDASSPDYYDVMLATEFGLVDVEAGDPLCPDNAATREFAAHTLNLCLGFQPEEGTAYTFSEADEVTYPDDIQIAIDMGWLTLSDSDFLPEQGITIAEKNRMIAAAETVLEQSQIEEGQESTYLVRDGVVVIPEETEVRLTDENELSFCDYNGTLKAGDIFVVMYEGLPVARRAVQVTVQDNMTVVQVEGVDAEEAFSALNVQGSFAVDLTQAQAVGDDVTLSYIVGGTEEMEYEDGVVYYSLDDVADQEVNAVVATKTIPATESNEGIYAAAPSSKGYSPVPGMEGIKISCKITDVKPEFKLDLAHSSAIVKVSGKVSFSFGTDSEGIDLPYFENDFVKVPIGVVGYFSPTAVGKVTGSVSLCLKSNFSVGMEYNRGQKRLICDFKKESFTLDVKADIRVGFKLAAGVDLAFAKAELYVEGGAKGGAKSSTYFDGQKPERCTHVSAYLYFNAGGKVTFNFLTIKTEVKIEQEIYKESNSPVKIALHYEDGAPVGMCTRTGAAGGEPGSGGSGGSGTLWGYKYYTPFNSQYAYNGVNRGTGTDGKEYAIFEYSLDSDDQATITKYNGNVAALNIPAKIDGYTVVGIGASVFKNNNKLQMVNMPDTVTQIASYAFSGCSNLASVSLPKSLVSMGCGAFYNCDSLTSIEIPKSLERVTSGGPSAGGAFCDCDNLRDVTFEQGTTEIAENLFNQCTGLEEIVIPDTVTVIEQYAFYQCTNLKKVTIPNSVTQIASYTFSGCSNLASVSLPKSLVSMGCGAFYNCDSLTSIEIPKSLERVTSGGPSAGGAFHDCDNLKTVTFEQGTTEIAEYLFSQCTGLEEIVIPDTVTVIELYAFYQCTNLKKVTIPNSVTQIASYAFSGCSNLASVSLPKSLVSMGCRAFYNCDSLTSIEIPKSLERVTNGYNGGAFHDCDNLKTVTFEQGTTEIAEYLFSQCTGLEEIVIPDTVTVIELYAFYQCSNLKKVTIPNSVTQIASYAFSGCSSLLEIRIPDTVVAMGEYVFSDCSNLNSVRLSKSLVSMGCGAFHNCDSLASIEIPKSLERVTTNGYNGGAFHDCDNLKTVTFEQGTTEIAENLFYKCTGLEEIVIPDTVTVIELYAFYQCTNLKKVTIPNSVTQIDRSAFNGCSSLLEIRIPDTVVAMGEYVFAGCTSLTTITLPETVEAIRRYAFQNSGLTEITLPDNVETIEERAFYNNDSLAKVVCGDKLATVGTYAFYDCDALTGISLPDSVTTIGTYCFADCELLKDVTLGTGLTQIPSYAFNLCPSLEKIVLPYRVATVQSNAFTNCTKLTELTVPRATTSIGSNAFSYPTKMKVYGVSGTYAETWANSVNAAFVAMDIPATAAVLDKTSITINKGSTAFLNLTVTPVNFTDEVVWKSSNESVATVADSGQVSAKTVGETTIRATVGGVSASCKVKVVQPVTSISLNRTSLSLSALDTFQLTASVYPSNANNSQIEWTSSDNSIATVSASGLVTAMSKGTATITAKAKDGSGITRSCSVSVTGNVYVVNSVAQMESPHNYENNCQDVWIYTMSGKNKLAVTFDKRTELEEDFDYLYIYSGTGKLIGTYTGTELSGKTVTVEGDTVRIKLESDSSGNDWGFKVVSITEAVSASISLKTTGATIPKGKTATVQIASKYPANDTVTYKSSDTKVATVNSNGVVTGKAPGTARITVTTKSGATATFTVTVVNVELKKTSGTVSVGKTVAIQVKSKYPSGDKVTYKSSNTKIATVNSKGVVTGKAPGTAKITVTTKSGATATFTVKVVNIKLKKTSGTVKVGKTVTIQVKSKYPSGDKVTYKSSNTKVATVNSKGVVTGKAPGTAKITATTKSGATATYTIKVKK